MNINLEFLNQRTLAERVKFKGIGIHTGEISRVEIDPAEPNTGIIFFKMPENILIGASVENFVENNYATRISQKDVGIVTIEHLMAAFYGLGIDNAIVYVYGNEIPILDGSSICFLKMMGKKIKELDEEKIYALLNKKISIKIGDRFIEYEPTSFDNSIYYKIDYLNYPFLTQEIRYFPSFTSFKLIAGAKTFVRPEDIEALRLLGLGRGIILNENTRLVNLNSKEDFVSHKLLDLLGDLYLLGAPLLGKIKCYKGGHILNTMFVKEAAKELSFIKSSSLIIQNATAHSAAERQGIQNNVCV